MISGQSNENGELFTGYKVKALQLDYGNRPRENLAQKSDCLKGRMALFGIQSEVTYLPLFRVSFFSFSWKDTFRINKRISNKVCAPNCLAQCYTGIHLALELNVESCHASHSQA